MSHNMILKSQEQPKQSAHTTTQTMCFHVFIEPTVRTVYDKKNMENLKKGNDLEFNQWGEIVGIQYCETHIFVCDLWEA